MVEGPRESRGKCPGGLTKATAGTPRRRANEGGEHATYVGWVQFAASVCTASGSNQRETEASSKEGRCRVRSCRTARRRSANALTGRQDERRGRRRMVGPRDAARVGEHGLFRIRRWVLLTINLDGIPYHVMICDQEVVTIYGIYIYKICFLNQFC